MWDWIGTLFVLLTAWSIVAFVGTCLGLTWWATAIVLATIFAAYNAGVKQGKEDAKEEIV